VITLKDDKKPCIAHKAFQLKAKKASLGDVFDTSIISGAVNDT